MHVCIFVFVLVSPCFEKRCADTHLNWRSGPNSALEFLPLTFGDIWNPTQLFSIVRSANIWPNANNIKKSTLAINSNAKKKTPASNSSSCKNVKLPHSLSCHPIGLEIPALTSCKRDKLIDILPHLDIAAWTQLLARRLFSDPDPCVAWHAVHTRQPPHGKASRRKDVTCAFIYLHTMWQYIASQLISKLKYAN